MAGSSARGAAPTLRDVAQRAGVSTATAARALGAYGAVSDSARQRVLSAAAELGYARNELARTMITGQSNTIGLVVADVENPFFSATARGVFDAARAAGYEVVLTNTDEDLEAERSAVKVLLAKRVDGIIVAPASPVDVDHLVTAQESGCPVVLLDRRVRDFQADAVLVDSYRAARDVVGRLLDAGHRRIAMVTGASDATGESPSGEPNLSTGRDRVNGYLAALREAGVARPNAYLRTGAGDLEQARALTADLLALEAPPTAVFASDSRVALGVLKAIREAGVEMPGQMSLVAFDDADWTSVVAPPVSVVAQPVHELGRRAAEVLLARVNGDSAPLREHVMQTSFVARQSIAPPPPEPGSPQPPR